MKTYTKYVLFGVIKIFLMALFFFTIALLSILVIQMTLKSNVPILLSVCLTPFFIPYIFSVALPASSLLAVTVFFSKMGGNNELIALKSMGIAPWRILVPVWIFMFGISICGIWFNDLSTSWTRMQIKKALLEGFESTLLSQLKTEKRFVTPTGQYEVKVTDVLEDGTLLNPEFSGKIGGINGIAESAKLEVDFNLENPLVKIHLNNAEFETSHVHSYIPTVYDFSIPLSEVFHSNSRVDPPARDVKHALNSISTERVHFHKNLASKAMFSFLSGNISATTTPEWQTRTDSERYYDRQQIRYKLTIPRICAAGFSSFFFVWVGAPYAILSRKADFIYAFFASFLPIAGVYYSLFTLGLQGAKGGFLPPSATWLGNIALGIIGVYYLKKIH